MELDVSYSSDKYQYTMGKTFYDEGMEQQRAIFNMFFRQAPDNNNWAVVSGISEVLEMVQGLGNKDTAFFEKFLPGDNYAKFREFISKLKFTGDIYAMREGEIVFPGEPVIIVDAPLIEAQVLETPLLSIMNHQMAIATKASRVTRATSKPVSEFGSRRAHGPWAAIYGAKAAYIGGCSGSSNIVTADIFGTPASGTMAHSYVTSFGCSVNAEKTAFDKYIKSHYGEQLVLLIDTYDTLRCGIKNAIKSFKDNDITNEYKASYGIRLDSGDLAYLSVECRRMLDEAGLDKCKIFATNSLDEYIISDLERQNAAIDVYGVGDAIATSKHNPCFGNVYKLVQIGEDPVLKRSEDKSKIINPGFQVTYRIMQRGFFRGDVTCIRGDSMVKTLENLEEFTIRSEFDNTKTTHFKERDYNFKILQGKVMEKGIICSGYDSAAGAKEYYVTNLAYFNPTEKRIINPHYYKVDISDDLYDLKNRIIDSLIKEIREYE